MRLNGKTAIVTGAASGIGWASTVAFLREGAKVCLLDQDTSRAQELLSDFSGEFSSHNLKELTAVITVDVSNPESVVAAVASAHTRFGKPEILVNCAAAQTPAATVADLALEEWCKAFNINVTGAFLMSKAVIPLMQANGRGSVIHIASQLGSVAMAGFSAYCATKGAILQLTKTMALDHAADGIRVNSLSPGATLTERLRTRFGSDEGAFDALGAGYPMGRLGTPDEIANGAVFLASDESSFVTGSDLLIDGGYLAQ
ncbi:MAG: SDR family NAD(P)-dependent oxidoreductase [Granulosicoccus sp.]